jgi:hypothetical protein
MICELFPFQRLIIIHIDLSE